MTLDEVAKYLRIHKSTVYRMTKEGKIPAIKIGNQWRFKKNKIDEWLGKQVEKKEKEKALKK
jgi:excisionase family DNA binding protein